MKSKDILNTAFESFYDKEVEKTGRTLKYLYKRAGVYGNRLTELLYEEPSKLLRKEHKQWEEEVKEVRRQYDKFFEEIIEEVESFKKFSDEFRNS